MSTIPDLVERLAVVLRAEQRRIAAEAGLPPVQLDALRFLVRANRYSRQPGAVTEFLQTTPGTTSQTLTALEQRGLLRKLPDERDQRRVHCVPTDAGRALVASVESVSPLLADATLEEPTHRALTALLSDLQRRHGGRSFGVCRTCAHFRPTGAGDGICGLTGDPLTSSDAQLVCREHAP
ncbi:MAG: winged helix-turn-helix transcriptional regulator [Myxococcales bacterium]|nr:winged helix-turn-helix transcriptional regulator [Myxococcales bacterium]